MSKSALEQDIQHIVDCALALSLMPADMILVVYADKGLISCKYTADERLYYATHTPEYVYHVRRPISREDARDILRLVPDYFEQLPI